MSAATETAGADDTPELDRLLEHTITPLRKRIAEECAYEITLTTAMILKQIHSDADELETSTITRGALVRFAALADVIFECLGRNDRPSDKQLLEIVGLPADLAEDEEVEL